MKIRIIGKKFFRCLIAAALSLIIPFMPGSKAQSSRPSSGARRTVESRLRATFPSLRERLNVEGQFESRNRAIRGRQFVGLEASPSSTIPKRSNEASQATTSDRNAVFQADTKMAAFFPTQYA
ncbi:MAG: hypothetical protein ACREDR_27020, partial [Blastocatellia bacterium]